MGVIAGLIGLVGGKLFGGGFLGSLLTNVLSGVFSSIFSKKPSAPSLQDSGFTSMVREPITAHQIVYGRVKKAGPLVYMSNTDANNQYLHLIVALAAHQCEEIEEVYFNETAVPYDPVTGAVTTGDYANHAEIFTSLGSDSQTTNQALLDNVPSDFTSAHRLRGICYVYCKLLWNSSIYSDVPNISVIMKGKNDVLDTRTATTGYTDNAALCILDYLKSTKHGLGITTSEYDDTNIDTEADICDELVALSAGGNEKRFTCNGIVQTSSTPQDNINKLLSSIAGKLTYRNGKFFILTGSYRAPALEITNADIIGSMQVSTRLSRKELFNGVRGVYITEDNNWQPADFPPVKSTLYKTRDNNERIWQDLDLPYTSSAATAQRISKILLFAARQEISATFVTNMKGFQAAIGDTITITDTDFGWAGKTFEVTEWQFIEGKNGMSVRLSVRETAPEVYSWDISEESTIDVAPNTTLPSIRNITAPSNLALLSNTDQLLQDGATIISRIKASWDSSTDNFVLSGGYVDIEYKLSADVVWTSFPRTLKGDSTQTFISPVSDGDDYDVRVRFRNTLGFPSDWTTSSNHTVIGKTAPPADVTNFAVSQNGAFVTFTWTEVSDIDLAGYEIRFGPSGTTNWTDAQRLGARIKGTAFTTGNVPPGTHTFLIKAVDTTENYSTNSNTYTVDITTTGLTVDTELTRDADGWTGTFTNYLLHGSTNSLVPDSLTDGDDADDIFDNTNVDFYSTCSYQWPTIDLGSDKDVRVWASIATKLLPDTTGVADPVLQIAYTSNAQGSDLQFLDDEPVIQSTGTFTNMVHHHTDKLVIDNQDLASVSGTLDEYCTTPYSESSYISPEFDLGSDLKLNLSVETTSSLGPEETSGTANVSVEIDYKTAAGAYDGFEEWTGGSFTGRYFKVKLITTPSLGKTVISAASLTADSFQPFTGVADLNARYITLKVVVDTDVGKVNITDYTITADA